MKSGRLSDQRRTKFGYGLRLTWIPKKIAGECAGSRDEDGAAGLWKSIHPALRKRAVFHSDFWPASEEVFPRSRHFFVGKESGKTSHIERLSLTLRQRASRLGRKTLSFSKDMKNHIGALWNFIHHYNENIAPNLATTS